MEANNMAAMREALVKASSFLHRHNMGAVCMPDGSVLPCWELAQIVDAALAAAARNCDVGTVAEQCDRHRAMCLKYDGCATCPRNRKNVSYKECVLSWAQEPYTEDNPQ